MLRIVHIFLKRIFWINIFSTFFVREVQRTWLEYDYSLRSGLFHLWLVCVGSGEIGFKLWNRITVLSNKLEPLRHRSNTKCVPENNTIPTCWGHCQCWSGHLYQRWWMYSLKGSSRTGNSYLKCQHEWALN